MNNLPGLNFQLGEDIAKAPTCSPLMSFGK